LKNFDLTADDNIHEKKKTDDGDFKYFKEGFDE
jgi:hypothetical protein